MFLPTVNRTPWNVNWWMSLVAEVLAEKVTSEHCWLLYSLSLATLRRGILEWPWDTAQGVVPPAIFLVSWHLCTLILHFFFYIFLCYQCFYIWSKLYFDKWSSIFLDEWKPYVYKAYKNRKLCLKVLWFGLKRRKKKKRKSQGALCECEKRSRAVTTHLYCFVHSLGLVQCLSIRMQSHCSLTISVSVRSRALVFVASVCVMEASVALNKSHNTSLCLGLFL